MARESHKLGKVSFLGRRLAQNCSKMCTGWAHLAGTERIRCREDLIGKFGWSTQLHCLFENIIAGFESEWNLANKESGASVHSWNFGVRESRPNEDENLRSLLEPRAWHWHRSTRTKTGWHLTRTFILIGEADWNWMEQLIWVNFR
jgi:hypothetical protein